MKHLLVLLGTIAATACGGAPHEKTPAGQPPVSARIEQVRASEVPGSFDAGGTVRARRIAVLSSRIVAPVLETRVSAGDRVRAGQTLIVLDSRDLAASRAGAEAGIAVARQAAAAAEADETAARAALVLATASHGRVETLRARNSATPGELDEAVAALRAAEARAHGAAARREEAARAVDAAQAAVTSAAVGQSFAAIAAPFDGVVTSRPADPGALAAPGTPLVTVEDTARFRLEVGVDASRIAALEPGTHVRLFIDALGGADVDAVVGEVARAVDPVAHTAIVKIDVPPIDGLRTGMYGRARIPAGTSKAITVPETAVRKRGQLSVVFVAESGVARMRLVHVGPVVGGRTVILAGVQPGESVLVDPAPSIGEGTPLQLNAPSEGRPR